MFKLVILIQSSVEWLDFEQNWPEFLKRAEQMPGLVREATSPVHAKMHGDLDVAMMHELFFESKIALQAAMASPEGQEAGQVLQTITGGQVTLLFAEHLEDELENIRALKVPDKEGPPGDKA